MVRNRAIGIFTVRATSYFPVYLDHHLQHMGQGCHAPPFPPQAEVARQMGPELYRMNVTDEKPDVVYFGGPSGTCVVVQPSRVH